MLLLTVKDFNLDNSLFYFFCIYIAVVFAFIIFSFTSCLADNTTSRDELLTVVHNLTQSMTNLKRCSATANMKLECVCRYQLCVSWYPCELKYCQDQGGNGQQTSYRCGIKTCSKCRNFHFHVNEKQQCFWDRKT